ncbi:hypothetical protein BJX76DRAFT_321542 [Aspergillus varians]
MLLASAAGVTTSTSQLQYGTICPRASVSCSMKFILLLLQMLPLVFNVPFPYPFEALLSLQSELPLSTFWRSPPGPVLAVFIISCPLICLPQSRQGIDPR